MIKNLKRLFTCWQAACLDPSVAVRETESHFAPTNLLFSGVSSETSVASMMLCKHCATDRTRTALSFVKPANPVQGCKIQS